MTSVAALLAAGAGTRYAGPTHKLLAEIGGVTVWERSLARVTAAGFTHVVLVTGAVPLTPTTPVTTDATAHVTSTVIVRHNPRWADGQATSVQVAIEAARELGTDAVTIGLADQPFVTTQAWRAVADADPACHLVVATYGGRPGPHPVRLDEQVWPLLPTEGDQGARSLLELHPEWVCRVPCIGSGDDIDTVEDLDRWKSC